MKKNFIIYFLLSSILVSAHTQNEGSLAVHQVSNENLIRSVFPQADKAERINEYWFGIIDKNGKVIGYALSSKPYCWNIRGYYGETPVVIITDKQFIIRKIALLSHRESLTYVKMLEKNGFFKLWEAKSFLEAISVKADAYSGATQTAKAIGENVSFLLDKGSKSMPY